MTPTLDPTVLERLAQEMAGSGIDLVGEMIAAFLEDAPGILAGARAAAKAEDLAALRRQVHKLKGAGVSMGMTRLAELCHTAETRASERDLTACSALVGDITGELEQASLALQSLEITGP